MVFVSSWSPAFGAYAGDVAGQIIAASSAVSCGEAPAAPPDDGIKGTEDHQRRPHWNAQTPDECAPGTGSRNPRPEKAESVCHRWEQPGLSTPFQSPDAKNVGPAAEVTQVRVPPKTQPAIGQEHVTVPAPVLHGPEEACPPNCHSQRTRYERDPHDETRDPGSLGHDRILTRAARMGPCSDLCCIWAGCS